MSPVLIPPCSPGTTLHHDDSGGAGTLGAPVLSSRSAAWYPRCEWGRRHHYVHHDPVSRGAPRLGALQYPCPGRRDVAATLAKGAAQPLHVLSVYDYPPVETADLPPSSLVGIERISCGGRMPSWSTNLRPMWRLSARRGGGQPTRVGNPREVIVEVATSLKAELLILGSHSQRGLLDVVLGGTTQQVSKAAPCLVVLVSPQPEGSSREPSL